MTTQNPLQGFFREPKLWTNIPSQGRYYNDDVLVMPENGELAVFAMTAKDELLLRNPDALLNGEAVISLIKSCVPDVKDPAKLLQNDVDVLLIAIHGATNETIEVSAKCTKCKEPNTGLIRAEDLLTTMQIIENEYKFTIETGLEVTVRPYTFASAIESGLVQFRNTQNLTHLGDIEDDIERIKAFSNSIRDMAALEFNLLCDSIASIKLPKTDDEEIIVSDRAHIREYLENCEKEVGKKVLAEVTEINKLGLDKKSKLQCENCSTDEEPFFYETLVELNPINFFTAS